MNNLVPVKRMDRNGKLVTKHVRAEAPERSQKAAIPSPQLGATGGKKAPQKPFKLRPKQAEQVYHSYRVMDHAIDFRLDPDPSPSSYYAFTANEAEIYEVFAATDCGGNALTMLQAGVRDKEGVKKYLKKHKAMDLFLDRDFAQEALEKNVNSYDFITHDEHWNQSYRDSPHYVDLVQFSKSSLNSGMNEIVLADIAEGTISFDDIKAIGITSLKPHDRLSSLDNILKRLKNGEGEVTIEKIKALISRSQEEGLERRDFNYVCRAIDRTDIDTVMACKDLDRLASEYHSYLIAPGSNRYEDTGDAVQRAIYSAQLKGEISGIRSTRYSDDFYDAGIPIDVAIEVASQGGGVREAQAIHDEGISSSVAGGWL